MNRSAVIRTFTGVITLSIYGIVGALAWDTVRWLSYLMGLLALIRFALLIRQWPRSE